jgi:hypothetical protein
MKLKKTTKSREDFLKSLTKNQYVIIVNKLMAFNFLKRVNSYRMDFDSEKEFVDEFFWMIFNDSLLSPIPQILAYQQAIDEKPEDRWQHFSEIDWNCFVDIYREYDPKNFDFKKVEYKEMKELFDKYFYKEFKSYSGE